MAASALINTGAWIAVTFLTRPADMAVLVRFWQKVRPAGPGWRPVRSRIPGDTKPADDMRSAALGVVLGVAFVYAGLFGTGFFLYGRNTAGAVAAAVFLTAGVLMGRNLRRHLASPQP
jgi:hypothetical protein